MSWTDERVEKLKTLWEQGKSASEIAKELGEVTRNAVIGKVHRMGLQSRIAGASDAKANEEKAEKVTAAPKAKAKTEPKAAPKPAEPKVEAEASAPPEKAEITPPVELAPGEMLHTGHSSNDEISEEARAAAARVEGQSKKLDLMQLTERTCKWPVGDPATEDFWFCGHPSQAGKPYCEAHVELAFQAPTSRR